MLLKKLNINIDKKSTIEVIFSIYKNFNNRECENIKIIESKINHDVKSIEYYIKEKFNNYNIKHTNFIHFGLTSQDINNTAISLSIGDYFKTIFNPNLIIFYSKNLFC